MMTVTEFFRRMASSLRPTCAVVPGLNYLLTAGHKRKEAAMLAPLRLDGERAKKLAREFSRPNLAVRLGEIKAKGDRYAPRG